MTTISIDPWIPGVDINGARCPGCRQTLAVVLDGVPGLPGWHYRRPTVPANGPRQGRTVIRIDSKGQPTDGRRCSYTGDDLARFVFIEQRKSAERASAA